MDIFDKNHTISIFYIKNSEREVHERHQLKKFFSPTVPSVALYIAICSLTILIL